MGKIIQSFPVPKTRLPLLLCILLHTREREVSELITQDASDLNSDCIRAVISPKAENLENKSVFVPRIESVFGPGLSVTRKRANSRY